MLLFAGVVWAFSPALHNGFVDFDDPDYITQNPHVRRGLLWENIRWAMVDSQQAGFWHPVTWLSHMADCQLFGLHAWGHHLTGILIHALNVVLVFLAFRAMTGTAGRSFVLAALFGLHPLRVESVAWAAERKDVLGAFFWLVTTLAYVRHVRMSSLPGFKFQISNFKSWGWYSLALGCFILGLMSKPTLVPLPFALLLLDYWPLQRLRMTDAPGPKGSARIPRLSSLLLEKVPFFLAAVSVAVLAVLTQNAARAVSEGVPLGARAGNALVSCCRYPGKLFYPAHLACFYPHPGYWPASAVVLSGIVLAAVLVMAVANRREHPWLLTGWLWFLLTLAPAAGWVQVGEQSMADRFTYIPSLGLIWILVWGVRQVSLRWHCPKPALAVAAVAAIAACAVCTRRQIGCWKDSETLFQHALAVTADNHVARFCLGVAYDEQGRPDDAIAQYRTAITLKPDYPAAHINLGFALANTGQFAAAMAELREALQLNGDPALAHFGIGLILGREGQLPESAAQFRQALEFRADWPAAHYNLGIALKRAGNVTAAIPELSRAVELEPDSSEYRFSLGSALAAADRQDDAIAQFQKSLRLRPDSLECQVNLANALARSGRLDEAVDQFHAALSLNPRVPEVHNNLGMALKKQRRFDEAAGEFQQALKLKPGYAEAQNNLDSLSDPANISRPH